MSAKNNLNKAMFDMFGVGNGSEEKVSAQEAAKPVAPKDNAEVKAAASSAPQSKQISDVKIVSPATYIAPSMVIEGNIRAKGDVEIAGELKGNVSSESTVTVRSALVGNIAAKTLQLIDCCVTGDIDVSGDVIVTEKSIVNGNVRSKSLSCSGKINGDVVISDNISLDAGSCIIGNITAATMVVARGAMIKGNIEMDPSK